MVGLPRRDFARALFCLTGSGLLLAPSSTARRAQANDEVSEGDVIIAISGQLIQIVIAVPTRVVAALNQSNPVAARVLAPAGAAEVIAYSGGLPERIEFVRAGAGGASNTATNLGPGSNAQLPATASVAAFKTNVNPGAQRLSIPFAIYGPNASAGPYRVGWTATSAIDVAANKTDSGVWGYDSIKIPWP